MFDQSIQFPSLAVLPFILLCTVHTTTADAKVYSVTPHGNAKVSSKQTLSEHESVKVVSKLKITVPEYGKSNYVEVKADLYYRLDDGDSITAHNTGGWFGFSLTGLTHGGHYGKERFTIKVWCNSSGSDGYIIRKQSDLQPKYRYTIGHISCAKS